MSPRQRILVIRLAEKIKKNPTYTEKLGITFANKKKEN